MTLPTVLCVILAGLALVLGGMLLSDRLAARAILRELAEKLSEDTNTVISLPSGGRDMRRLAAGLNRELRTLRSQRLRYLQGDRELKEAVTNISHDLRTPLTAISGYMDLMAREDLPPQARQYLDVMAGRMTHLKELTEELFRYSVILSAEEPGRPEDVSLNAAVEEALAAYYGALTQAGIEPEVTMPEASVVRHVDRRALGRVLSNILSNAIKYSAEDLAVELTADGTLRFSNAAPGLDGVQVGRLFDRFYTVESGSNATGLGLAIARTLVRDMGGALDAEYQNGRLIITLSGIGQEDRSP